MFLAPPPLSEVSGSATDINFKLEKKFRKILTASLSRSSKFKKILENADRLKIKRNLYVYVNDDFTDSKKARGL